MHVRLSGSDKEQNAGLEETGDQKYPESSAVAKAYKTAWMNRKDSGGKYYAREDPCAYQCIIRFRLPQTTQIVSAGNLMAGKIDSRLISGRVIFVGYTASGVNDLLNVPFQDKRLPEVVLNAHIRYP